MNKKVLFLGCSFLFLSACQKQESNDLIAKLLYTTRGTYDNQADQRDRIGGGLRQVIWKKKPPLPAKSITVVYDSDARPLAWTMRIEEAAFDLEELGRNQKKVQPKFIRWLFKDKRLQDVILIQDKNSEVLKFYTQAYVMQEKPELLKWFK